jgi:hypothetical protein
VIKTKSVDFAKAERTKRLGYGREREGAETMKKRLRRLRWG